MKDKSFNCLDHVKDFSQIFTIWGLCEIPQVIFRKPNDFTHIFSNHKPPKPSFQQHCPLHTHSDPRASSRQMIDLGWAWSARRTAVVWLEAPSLAEPTGPAANLG